MDSEKLKKNCTSTKNKQRNDGNKDVRELRQFIRELRKSNKI